VSSTGTPEARTRSFGKASNSALGEVEPIATDTDRPDREIRTNRICSFTGKLLRIRLYANVFGLAVLLGGPSASRQLAFVRVGAEARCTGLALMALTEIVPAQPR
jgi:hypothetical protein